MRLGIYQTSLRGHHGAYAEAIARAALEKGWQPKVVVPATCRTDDACRAISNLIGEPNLVYTSAAVPSFLKNNRLSLLQYHFRQHAIARKSLERIKKDIDFIFIPTLDLMDQAIRILGPPARGVPMAGMCMRIKFHLKSRRENLLDRSRIRLSEAFLHALVQPRNLRFVTTADPLLADYASTRPGISQRVLYVPEIGMDSPTVSKHQARRYLGIPQHEKVILVFGVITARKGIRELMASIQAAKAYTPPRVLVVGDIDEEVSEYLSSAAGQEHINSNGLTVIPGFANDELQSASFAAADAVWVSYIGHETMSGVFYQSVCCGLPVIAPHYGAMGKLAVNYSVGPTVNTADPLGTGNLIHELLNNDSLRNSYVQNCAALAERHRPIQFGRGVCNAIQAFR